MRLVEPVRAAEAFEDVKPVFVKLLVVNLLVVKLMKVAGCQAMC